jgi:hypothetical protein
MPAHSHRALKFIAAFKLVKALGLIIVAVAAFKLVQSQRVVELADWVTQLPFHQGHRLAVETVDKLPGPEPTPDAELVSVFSTGDAGLIALAHSLLDGEKIDYLVRGDGLQDLFGLGRMTGYSYAMGTAAFWVRTEDADTARVLLQDLIATKGSSDR